MIIAIIAVSFTATDGSPLGWGTWLGADWRQGEGELNFVCTSFGLFSIFCIMYCY